MNPNENKNLYTPLAEGMVNNSQPPTYQLPQSSQQQNPPFQIPTAAPNVNPTGVTNFMINNPQVGPKPMVVTCPHCRARSKTIIRYRSTAKTHIACLLLSWTMCCCLLPYCMGSCQNANHFCSICNTFIGTYHG